MSEALDAYRKWEQRLLRVRLDNDNHETPEEDVRFKNANNFALAS